MTGRPTSLTPEVEKAILDAITAGNYRATAATAAGVHRNTIINWEVRGATGEEPFASFLCALEKAEAIAEINLLNAISNAQPAVTGPGGSGADLWQAKAWMMERRWPKRWAQRVRAAVNEELDALISRLQQRLEPEIFRKVIDATREEAPTANTAAKH